MKVANKWKERAHRDRKNRKLIRLKQGIILWFLDIWDNITKKEVRIVERTRPDGEISYVIQRKNLLGFWFDCYGYGIEAYPTLIEAQNNIWKWDGSKSTDRVI